MYCLVQMWNSHTVMYSHVLVCTSTYRYVPIFQILSRGTGFQMFQNIILLSWEQSLTADSLVLWKSEKMPPDVWFSLWTFLCCPDETRPTYCRFFLKHYLIGPNYHPVDAPDGTSESMLSSGISRNIFIWVLVLFDPLPNEVYTSSRYIPCIFHVYVGPSYIHGIYYY